MGLVARTIEKSLFLKNFYIFGALWEQRKIIFLYFYVGFVFCNKCISFLHANGIKQKEVPLVQGR